MPRYTALSIVAPGGDRIASGQKTLEIRSWQPPQWPMRDLLIVQNTRYLRQDGECDPDGVALALVDVLRVAAWTPDELLAACASQWSPGYFAWQLHRVRPLAHRPRVVAKRLLYEIELSL